MKAATFMGPGKVDLADYMMEEPLPGCGSCHPCGTGYPIRCPDFRLFGLSEPGSMAEYLNVPALTCIVERQIQPRELE